MCFIIDALNAKVAFLDTDLGQPEVSEPGSITLNIITKPLVQPPHCLINEKESVECIGKYFCAGVTPTVHPTLYVESVKNAVSDYCAYSKSCAQQGSNTFSIH